MHQVRGKPTRHKVQWLPVAISIFVAVLVIVAFGYNAIGSKRIVVTQRRIGYLMQDVSSGSNVKVSLRRFADKDFRGIVTPAYTEFLLDYLDQNLTADAKYEFRMTCEDVPKERPPEYVEKCSLVLVSLLSSPSQP